MENNRMNRLSQLAVLVGKTEAQAKEESKKDASQEEAKKNAAKITALKRELEQRESEIAGCKKIIQGLENQNKHLMNTVEIQKVQIDKLKKKQENTVKSFNSASSFNKNYKDKVNLHQQISDYMQKRIVAIYGNSALVQVMNHFENPDPLFSNNIEEYKTRLMKVSPFL